MPDSSVRPRSAGWVTGSRGGSSDDSLANSKDTGGAAWRPGDLAEATRQWLDVDLMEAEEEVLEELGTRLVDFEYTELPFEARPRSRNNTEPTGLVTRPRVSDLELYMGLPLGSLPEDGVAPQHGSRIAVEAATPVRKEMMQRVIEAEGVLNRMMIMEQGMGKPYDPLANRLFHEDRGGRPAGGRGVALGRVDHGQRLQDRRGVRAREFAASSEDAERRLEGYKGGNAKLSNHLGAVVARERRNTEPGVYFGATPAPGQDIGLPQLPAGQQLPADSRLQDLGAAASQGIGLPPLPAGQQLAAGSRLQDPGAAAGAAAGTLPAGAHPGRRVSEPGELDDAAAQRRRMKKLSHVERVRLLQIAAHGEYVGSMGQDPRRSANIPLGTPLAQMVLDELRAVCDHNTHVRPYLDSCAVEVQRHARGWLARRAYRNLKGRTTMIQSMVRGKQTRQRLFTERYTPAQLALSKTFKMRGERRKLLEAKAAALRIQRMWRGRRVRRELWAERSAHILEAAMQRLWEETAEALVESVIRYVAREEKMLGAGQRGFRQERQHLVPWSPPKPPAPALAPRFYGVPRAHVYSAILRSVGEHAEGAGAGAEEGGQEGLGTWAWGEARIGLSVERWEREYPATAYSPLYSFSPRGASPRGRGVQADALAAAEAARRVAGHPHRGYVTLSGRPGTRPPLSRYSPPPSPGPSPRRELASAYPPGAGDKGHRPASEPGRPIAQGSLLGPWAQSGGDSDGGWGEGGARAGAREGARALRPKSSTTEPSFFNPDAPGALPAASPSPTPPSPLAPQGARPRRLSSPSSGGRPGEGGGRPGESSLPTSAGARRVSSGGEAPYVHRVVMHPFRKSVEAPGGEEAGGGGGEAPPPASDAGAAGAAGRGDLLSAYFDARPGQGDGQGEEQLTPWLQGSPRRRNRHSIGDGKIDVLPEWRSPRPRHLWYTGAEPVPEAAADLDLFAARRTGGGWRLPAAPPVQQVGAAVVGTTSAVNPLVPEHEVELEILLPRDLPPQGERRTGWPRAATAAAAPTRPGGGAVVSVISSWDSRAPGGGEWVGAPNPGPVFPRFPPHPGFGESRAAKRASRRARASARGEGAEERSEADPLYRGFTAWSEGAWGADPLDMGAERSATAPSHLVSDGLPGVDKAEDPQAWQVRGSSRGIIASGGL